MRLIFDLESDGLLHELTKIHCIVLKDIDSGEIISCANQEGYRSIVDALDLIGEASFLCGHNIISFDLWALKKIYPDLKLRSDCDIYDTLVMSRLLWPEIDPLDRANFSHIESKYVGRHSLAAWGERLGVSKIKFSEEKKKATPAVSVWKEWTPEMSSYCVGDVTTTAALYDYLQTQEADPRSVQLEHEFAVIMAKQERFGFPFNEKAAFALVNTLKARRAEIDEELQQVFPPIVEKRISKKTGKALKDNVTTFNPASRQQTADRLKEKYPEIRFGTTEKGNPQVDDDVLEKLGEKYPEATLLAEYQLLNKRIGQIAEGKESWLHHCEKYGDSRIHGQVKTNGCVSGRVAHRSPNMSQVPAVSAPYGDQCRALFTAPEGWNLVGTDASALELRALGTWLAHFDGGEYARLVSTEGFDIHSFNAQLFGIWDGTGEIQKQQRNLSKSCIFAVCYGAGSRKVGSLFYPKGNEQEMIRKGKEVIDTFYKKLPAIKKLKDAIEERIDTRGYLIGIDGRRLQIRSRHSALNQLLQSTGAVLMKKATCILYFDLQNQGLQHDRDYGFCGFYHDEWQIAVKPEYTDLLQQTSVEAIKKSGEYFKLRCPFTGESRVGKNWAECH